MYDLFFYILSLQPAQTYNKPEMTGNLVHKSHCIFWIYISQIWFQSWILGMHGLLLPSGKQT